MVFFMHSEPFSSSQSESTIQPNHFPEQWGDQIPVVDPYAMRQEQEANTFPDFHPGFGDNYWD